MLDLHLHSTFSDGTCTPEELVQQAHDLGVFGIALTDHDTVAGVPRLMAAGAAQGVATDPRVAPADGYMELWAHFGITAASIADAVRGL